MATTATPPVVRRRADLDLAEGDDLGRYVVMAAPPQESGTGYLLAGLLVGAVIGAAVGLFLAPHSGEETRRQMLRQLPGGLGEAVEESATAATEAVKNVVPSPSNATPSALDPVAQVAQYQAPPVSTATPAPYSTDGPAPPSRPTP